MALQIANPVVVRKMEQLAKATGLSKTAVVDRALDRLIRDTAGSTSPTDRMAALLAQLDRIPDQEEAFDPLSWDERGLPK